MMTDNNIYLTEKEQEEIMLNAVCRVMWEKYDNKSVTVSEDVFKAASYALEETYEKMNEKHLKSMPLYRGKGKLNEQMTDSAKDENKPTETDPYKLFIVTDVMEVNPCDSCENKKVSELSDDDVRKMIDSTIKDTENDFSDWENAARDSMIKDLTDIFF